MLFKVVFNWLYLEVIWKQESDLSVPTEVCCYPLECLVQYDNDLNNAVW